MHSSHIIPTSLETNEKGQKGHEIGHCGDLQVMTEFTMLIRYKAILVRSSTCSSLLSEHSSLFLFRPAFAFPFLCCVLEVCSHFPD